MVNEWWKNLLTHYKYFLLAKYLLFITTSCGVCSFLMCDKNVCCVFFFTCCCFFFYWYLCVCAWTLLTCVDWGLTLYWKCLQALLVCLQGEVGQVLFDLACHLCILVQLLGIEKGTPPDPLLVPACLGYIQDGRIGTALAEWPKHTHIIRVKDAVGL